MVRFENEFGEIRRKKRGPISDSVLDDLDSLKLYPDEPVDSVIKRLLQSMNPKEMTASIIEKVSGIKDKMNPEWGTRIKARYERVHKGRMSNKEWVQKLLEEEFKKLEN